MMNTQRPVIFEPIPSHHSSFQEPSTIQQQSLRHRQHHLGSLKSTSTVALTTAPGGGMKKTSNHTVTNSSAFEPIPFHPSFQQPLSSYSRPTNSSTTAGGYAYHPAVYHPLPPRPDLHRSSGPSSHDMIAHVPLRPPPYPYHYYMPYHIPPPSSSLLVRHDQDQQNNTIVDDDTNHTMMKRDCNGSANLRRTDKRPRQEDNKKEGENEGEKEEK